MVWNKSLNRILTEVGSETKISAAVVRDESMTTPPIDNFFNRNLELFSLEMSQRNTSAIFSVSDFSSVNTRLEHFGAKDGIISGQAGKPILHEPTSLFVLPN